MTRICMRSVKRSSRNSVLSAKSELGDQCSVPLYVLSAEVVEEPAPLTDHHQQAATTVMVVAMLTEMLGEVVDSLREKGYLNLR